MAPKQTNSKLLSAAVFVILEIAALLMLRSSSILQDIWFTKLSFRVTGLLWRNSESIKDYFNLRKQNEDLSADLFSLQAEILKLRSRQEVLEQELSKVDLGSSEFEYIPATIVKMSHNNSHNYIIINKGSKDGIKAPAGIVSSKGVVGIIGSVDEHYSYGLTLMNNDVRIGAKLGREELTAMVVWDGISTNKALALDIPPHHTIFPGDTVVTSGYSSVFPAQIPIGTTGQAQLVDGSTVRVGIDLFQDFETLRYVTIVQSLVSDQIKALEDQYE